MSRRAVVLTGMWVATLLGALTMVGLIAAMLAELGEGPELLLVFTVLAANAVAFGTVGLLIAHQRPGNRIAWVLAAAGLLLPLTFVGFAVGAWRFISHGSDDAIGGLFAVIGSAALGPTLFVTIPLLAILFPDGRLPGPRWRLPVAITASMLAVASVLTAMKPGPVDEGLPSNPRGIEHDLVAAAGELSGPLLFLGIAIGAVLAIAAVATRFRRSAGIERQQVKWLLAAVVVIGLTLPPSFVDADGDTGFSMLDAVAMASLALLPLSVWIAVTRHGLYEIDRVVGRTVAYAIVSVVLALVFVVTNLGLQAVLSDVTGSSTLTTAAATLVVAALFQPLRRRVQALVDRRFNRARYDGQATTAVFADRVRNEVDLPTLRDELVAAAAGAVRPAGASLWLRARHEP